MKIPQNVLAFANENIDVYKKFRDYFNHYRSINSGAKVEFDSTVSFEEKNEKMHEAMLGEIARVAGLGKMEGFAKEVWASHPTYKWASFAVVNAMIDMILPETIIDSIGLYSEVRTIGFGDSAAFSVKPRDLFVVTKAGRGKRTSEMHKQFDGQVTLIPEEHDVTVGVNLYRVLAGQENLAEFTMKAVRSIETAMTLDAYNAFNTAMGNLSTGATGLKVAGWSQDEAVKLAQKVGAYNFGAKPVFMGTQVALSKILPANSNYRYSFESDYVRVGYMQTAFGYDALVLPQIASQSSQFTTVLADDRIYIVSPSSQKLVKLVIEGSTQAITTDIYANANLTQTTTLKKNWVAGIATNSVAGMISL